MNLYQEDRHSCLSFFGRQECLPSFDRTTHNRIPAMNSTLLAVQNIFREVFDNPTLVVAPNTGPADVEGWDSVGQVKLILAIEEQFGFRFSETDVTRMSTAGQFAAAIDRLTGNVA
jgi:acyl carrier protein